MKKCTYLGHVVGNGQVKPDPAKICAVEKLPTPQTKKAVRTFLGFTGYYRKLIGNYSLFNDCSTLSDLTRKSLPDKVAWSAECDHAFIRLKKTLCKSPILCNLNFDKPFILQSDASDMELEQF